MCLECSGKHRGLGVHISFVRSVTMDSWSEIQVKKMEAGGNEQLNAFFAQYGIPKETDIVAKYNTSAASIYRDRIQTLADGLPWRDPPVVKESLSFGKKKPPLPQGGSNVGGGSGNNGSWDNWDDDEFRSSNDIKRNQSVSDFRGGGGVRRDAPLRSRSTEDIYTRSQLEASAANKESFFASKMEDNNARPEGLPPSQGGKYVGFGSGLAPKKKNDSEGDVISLVSQGFGRLSTVAASAAQSAANVVKAGTEELSSKVKEGGDEYKVNETVNVVTAKTTEIGNRTWGIMKGVMAMASQKVEEYTKEGGLNWKGDNWQRNDSESYGYYQDFNQDNKGQNSSSGGHSSSSGNSNSCDSSSWDDWDRKDNDREEESVEEAGSNSSDGWAGWDDGYDNFQQGTFHKKTVGHNGRSDTSWTGGGFH